MATRRVRNPIELVRLRAAHVARVRRTVRAVRRGKVELGAVAEDIRGEVDERVRGGKP